MKQVLTLIISTILIASLVGCSYAETSGNVTKYYDLVVVEEDNFHTICYDNNTKVMYLIITGSKATNGITPIYNSDGSLMLYED